MRDDRPPHIFLIAGEASGDLHGASLVKALKRKRDDLLFSGIGGPAMQAAGVHIVVDASTLSVVGLTEVFSRLPEILKGMSAAKAFLKARRPDLLILIDFPDFNLKMAAFAKKWRIPVLYYISPQIWAWRSGRVTRIGKLVAHMAVILPFEVPFYRRHGIPVTFVGHPLMDSYADRPGPSPAPPLRNGIPVIGLLPGSRESEIVRHLPVMLRAARILSGQMDVHFILSVAPGAPRPVVESIYAPFKETLSAEIDTEGARSVFARTRLVVAASGTVTLEAAVAGTPLVIIYKISPLSYRVGKALIRVPNIGLVNLIAGKEIAPELIQDEANPETIAATVKRLITDPASLEAMRLAFADVRRRLGDPGASDRVADIAMEIMKSRRGKEAVSC